MFAFATDESDLLFSALTASSDGSGKRSVGGGSEGNPGTMGRGVDTGTDVGGRSSINKQANTNVNTSKHSCNQPRQFCLLKFSKHSLPTFKICVYYCAKS